MNKISKYASFYKQAEYRKIFFNIANFTFFQLTNYLVPLITIPYIVRIIGAGKFGVISFVQAVIYYFLIIVDYGFDISGTQKIAQNRDSQSELNKIYSTIMWIKLVLMIASMFVLYLSYLLFDKVQQYYLVYLFTFGMIPAQTLLSVWFFTGMEEMKYLNYTNLIARLGYLAGILLLITNQEDFYLIPAINSSALFIAGIISIWFVYHKFNIRYHQPSIFDIKQAFKEGWHVFISNFSINLYRNSNIFILGLLAPEVIVGFYSAGEKIVKILQSIFTPITRVLYPYISRKKVESPEKGIKVIRFLIFFISIATGIILLFLIVFTEPLTMLILGEEFTPSILVIRICSIALLFGPVNYIIGIIFMLNFNLKMEFTKSVITSGIFSVIFCFILSYFFDEVGTSIVFVATEILLMANYIFYIQRNQAKWRTVHAE